MRFLIIVMFVWFPYSALFGERCFNFILAESLRKTQNTIEGTLHKVAVHNYIGEARLSGVLIWWEDFIQDMEGWVFRELIFYPDKNPLFDKYMRFTLYRDDDLVIKFRDSKQHIFDKLKILGKDWEEKYALSEMMVRVELTIFNHQYIDTDLIESGINVVDFKDLVLKGDVKQCFFKKDAVASLSYASKDSHINLRESPNGNILRAITKDEIKQYKKVYDPDYGDVCELIESTKDLGAIVYLGKDSTNPKWLKVAYVPKEAKDTSKAIYGVIHENQVSLDCSMD